jgi:hypothetical protein
MITIMIGTDITGLDLRGTDPAKPPIRGVVSENLVYENIVYEDYPDRTAYIPLASMELIDRSNVYEAAYHKNADGSDYTVVWYSNQQNEFIYDTSVFEVGDRSFIEAYIPGTTDYPEDSNGNVIDSYFSLNITTGIRLIDSDIPLPGEYDLVFIKNWPSGTSDIL